MLAYVGLSCGQRGPILWLCWPMFASCWPMLSQKIRKMFTAKKLCKTQDIWWSASLSLLYVGPSWVYVGPSWGQCGPILGLCWPILGAMLAHLGAMFALLDAYVGPCWPILSHKLRKRRKNAKSTKHRKTRQFLAGGRGRRQGARPLSPTERRETPSARTRPGGPWPDIGLPPLPPTPKTYFHSDPAMSEANLHLLSGAVAFGGTDTLGAVAFRGISRSVSEIRVGKGGTDTATRN